MDDFSRYEMHMPPRCHKGPLSDRKDTYSAVEQARNPTGQRLLILHPHHKAEFVVRGTQALQFYRETEARSRSLTSPTFGKHCRIASQPYHRRPWLVGVTRNESPFPPPAECARTL